MLKSMLVSVILTSYNQRAYLREAVESVLAQTYPRWELIIVDNGSTDGSPEILKGYGKDPRVTLILHERNGSVSQRFNEAIDRSRGELISFLYSDDTYLPHKLERQVALFEQAGQDCGVVYGPPMRHDVITGKTWRYPTIKASGFILRRMLLDHTQGSINMLSPMSRRRCFQKYRFYEDLFAEGESIYYRIAMTERFLYDDEPLVVLREHLHNFGKATRFNVEAIEVVCDRLAAAPDLPPGHRSYIRTFRTQVLRNGGWCVLRVGGDVAWARRAIGRSVLLSPLSALNPRVAGGLALSLLPAGLRARVNALGHALRRLPGNKVNVEVDYK